MSSLQSLRIRLGLLLVLAFTPVFGLTAYWSYLDQTERLDELEATELLLVRQVATTYGQVIRRSREVLYALARLAEVQALDGPKCSALFRDLLESYHPQYSNIDAARADGEIFCSAKPFDRPINVSDSQGFIRAVENRGFAVGDFKISLTTKQPILTMAFPVFDENGEIVAVIGALLSVDWLNQLAAKFSMEGSSLAMIDRSGRVVVKQPDPATWIGRDVSETPLFAARLRGETRLETDAFDGVRRRFVLATVDGVPLPASLSVSVGLDYEQALADFHPALYRDLGVLFVVAFAAVAIAWLGTERSVIRRVNALLTATRRLAAGDLGARADTGRGGPSELVQLGRAFDDMAAALEQREREMSDGRKALAEQEALLRTVIEALPVGVWIVGPDGKILAANHQAREIWGGPKPAVEDSEEGGWWADIEERIAADDGGVARALCTGAHSSNEIVDIEALDGTRKTIAQWSVPLRDVERRIVGAVAVNQDVTARKRAEAALRESEERFRNMAENLPLMLWVTDASGAGTYINQQWYDYTGQTPPEALGFGWLDALHPDDAVRSGETLLAANAKHEPFLMEYRVRRHDGEYRHFIDAAAPRLGPAGEFLGYVGCVIDIHDRKQAGEHLRLAVEAAPNAMIMADERGTITLVNSQTEQLFGYTRAELLGQSVEMLLPEGFRAAQPDPGQDLPVADVQVTDQGGDLFGLSKDGRAFPVEIGLSVIRTEQGGFALGSITDITERKRVEETRARLEAQLRQAQKMEALGTLAGGIAHDFNNILSAIMGNVDLAGEDIGADHAAQESLAVIRKASKRARDLVQQILTFSRQQPVERHVVELREVAEESVRLLRATLPAGIELVSSFAPDTPHVLADRTHIHQVLMNLCTNAWHAIEGPVGRIEIALAAAVVGPDADIPGLQPGRHARLTVTDTGKGMDRAMVERIFDPFFTTKAFGEGTGLGLAVVDGIVKNHDGAIQVHTAPGWGTVFHLYFPAVEAEVAAKVRDAPSDLPRGNGQRILYLDDEKPLVNVAKRLLGRLGYEVKGFTSPAEALAAFRADPAGFDLCVTDLNMPVVSGLEIAMEILRERPDLPVAVASGNVTETLRMKAQALGIREVIYKPSTLTDLAQAVQRMLQRG
jgi:PAS domain S-box-containing protein